MFLKLYSNKETKRVIKTKAVRNKQNLLNLIANNIPLVKILISTTKKYGL